MKERILSILKNKDKDSRHSSYFNLCFSICRRWLNQLNEKRREVQGYKNEIGIFRGWESEEGVRRTVGNIKLLRAIATALAPGQGSKHNEKCLSA